MKQGFLKVAAAVPHVRVADCKYNADAAVDIVRLASEKGVKLVTFPELSLTGYTCGDLFFHKPLIDASLDALKYFASETAELDAVSVVGLPVSFGDKLYNCAAVVFGGRVLGLVPKTYIPDHAEFSERRWFAPAPEKNISFELDGDFVTLGTKQLFVNSAMPDFTFGVEICEDLWVAVPPSCGLACAGAKIICNLSASDELVGKENIRRDIVKVQSNKLICGYIYSSSGDGESTTDLVFGGPAMISECGKILRERTPFAEDTDILSEFGSAVISELDLELIAAERRRKTTFNMDVGEYTESYFAIEMMPTELTRRVEANPFVPSDAVECRRRCERILTIQASGLKTRIERAYAKKIVVGISGGLDSCLALLVMTKAIDMLGRDRKDIIAVTMPCFGTTKRTKNNATVLCEELGVDFREVNIYNAVKVHFEDIGHDENNLDVVYENAQARERTQVLMDIANAEGGMVIGTGDLSELALGWATYNGDHMSMYGVNGGVPKTLIRHIVRICAEDALSAGKIDLAASLGDILDTPVSPELLPADKAGDIAQKTEDLVGPYELHDLFLYYMLRYGFGPQKIFRLAKYVQGDKYDDATIYKWLAVFMRRFFNQQFKRSCLPDGPKVGSVGVSPRGDLKMPSDAANAVWQAELEELKTELGL